MREIQKFLLQPSTNPKFLIEYLKKLSVDLIRQKK